MMRKGLSAARANELFTGTRRRPDYGSAGTLNRRNLPRSRNSPTCWTVKKTGFGGKGYMTYERIGGKTIQRRANPVEIRIWEKTFGNK